MLEIVSQGFSQAKAALTGRTTLTAENIDAAVRQIRVALLEADVEIGVVKALVARLRDRALGEVVTLRGQQADKKLRLTPGDHFVGICQRELVRLLGPVEEQPIAFFRPLTTIMMVGLQGTGKTTTCGKLAKRLLQAKRRPLLVAADIYRPAAIKQLQVLGEGLGVPVWTQPGMAPPELCDRALAEARRRRCDVVIFDTAGRLTVDETLMEELASIKARTRPHNIFLVCDAMAGQDTVRTARAFEQRLDLTGFVLTKCDGDARGGAALSLKAITGKPIKFLGVGEGLGKLEAFRPEGLASRILGMGDIVGLVEDLEQVVEAKQVERDNKKFKKGQFSLDDFARQLRTFKKLGPLKDVVSKIPGMGSPQASASVDPQALIKTEAMIQSMTPQERQQPDCIDARRRARIARGSGRSEAEVKDLLARFGMMQTMMQNVQRHPGMLDKLFGKQGPGRGGLPAGLPGGLDQGLPQGLPKAMPPGMSLPPGMRLPAGGMPGRGKAAASDKLRAKAKNKRKAEKKARKKARR